MDIIQDALQNLKVLNAKTRELYTDKMLDYYNGSNTSAYIEDKFAAKAFDEIPPYEANITRKFINKLSRIYTVGAVRNAGDKYNELTAIKNVRFKHIERMTRLIGTVANQVVFKDGRFDYKPVYFFHPHFGDDPYTPIAVSYPVLTQPEDIRSSKPKYIIWTDRERLIVNENGETVLEEENPYGILPFVFTHRENQTNSFYVQGANDIVSANEHANITLTELQLGLRFQMFGQMWSSGTDTGTQKQRMGTDTIIDVPLDGRFGIEAPAGDIEATINAVKFQIELVAQNNHLWVQWSEQGGEVPSGISLMIRDLERSEDYQDDLALWNMYEKEFYSVEKAIAKYNNISLPENMGLDFNEPEYPKTVQDQILWDEHRLAHNLTTEGKLMVEYNQDLTIEEAEAQIADNKTKNKKRSILETARQSAERPAKV